MKNKLNESSVRFQSEDHTYHAEGRNPQGITPVVNWVFDDTYKGIPANVMKMAADHGTAVHNACEFWDSLKLMDDEYEREVRAYIAMKESEGLETLCSEYVCDLYDDELDFASPIDKVFKEKDGCYPLGDIKTTSNIYLEKVALQLSIYAYMFEKLNPDKKAGRLFEIWLPREQYGQPSLIEVPRIPVEQVLFILHEYVQGGEKEYCRDIVLEYCQCHPMKDEGWLPANIRQVEMEIAEIEREQKRMKTRSEELRAGLRKLMQEHDVKKWEGEHIILTRKAGGVRTTLDSAKVKTNYPDVYAECVKESSFAESLTIKIKEQ